MNTATGKDTSEFTIEQVDGRFTEAHLESLVPQFQQNIFEDNNLEAAMTNLEYFTREFNPELANPEFKPDVSIYDSAESAITWAARFGYPINIARVFTTSEDLLASMTDNEKSLKCDWAVTLGISDSEVEIAFATTLKGAVLLAIVHYFRHVLHTFHSIRGPQLVGDNEVSANTH